MKKMVQARTRFNEFSTNEMNEILKKLKEQMIPITNKLQYAIKKY